MKIRPRHRTLFETNLRHFYKFLVFATFLYQPSVCAQEGPRPPCGKDPVPHYPGVGDSAIVKVWSKSEVGGGWTPPSCTGWATPGFTTLVTITARFRYESGTESLVRRIGAISELTGIRYWSSTQKNWQTLIVNAHALTGLQSSEHRDDFTLDEMKENAVLYFEQIDNRSGKALYRLHLGEVSADRIVFDIENVSTIRSLHITVFHPGELQSVYFLDRESPTGWRYYSIARTGMNANWLLTRNESSAVNRAVAFYRHIVGIPTDQEPPVAR